MLQSWPYSRCWIILLAVARLLGGATRVRSQANDPNAGTDIVGRIITPTSAMGFVGILPDEQEPTGLILSAGSGASRCAHYKAFCLSFEAIILPAPNRSVR